jgi:hypothetical protein
MTKITMADVSANIAATVYFTGADGFNGHHFKTAIGFPNTPREFERLTFCVCELRNGFLVTGQSVCANLEDFDAGIGRELAYEDAVDKVIGHLTYAAMSAPVAATKVVAKRVAAKAKKDPKPYDPTAPFGRKKDGTPAKQRGRARQAMVVGAPSA